MNLFCLRKDVTTTLLGVENSFKNSFRVTSACGFNEKILPTSNWFAFGEFIGFLRNRFPFRVSPLSKMFSR